MWLFEKALASGAACCAIASILLAGEVHAANFYENKTIRLVIVTDTGGSYDLVGRLIARHIGRHIPGNPDVVPQNMPGASGLEATNYIYNIAPQDGTVLGAVHPVSASLSAVIGNPNARYDPDKFQWIGTLADPTNVLAVWHAAPAKTWQEAQQKEVAVGAVSADGSDAMSANLANGVLGTKFKVITGYKGGGDITLAMERGEVDARGIQTWSGWIATKPDWVAQKKIIPLYQIALEPDPALPGVPLLTDIVSGEENKGAVKLFTSVMAIGRPMLVGPKVPAETVQVLRRAYDATMTDPAFIAEAQRLKIDLAPMSGERVQRIVAEMDALSPAVVGRFKSAVKLN